MLAVGAGGGCLDILSLVYFFSFLSPSLWETARYRLKYCLKGPLNPKQPTNQTTTGKTVMTQSFKPRGYKSFFMLNSAEHEILNARKYKNVKIFSLFQDQVGL